LFFLKESLYVFANKLTGSLPTTIGQLYRLQEFQAQQNHLQGTLPLQIGMLNKLGKTEKFGFWRGNVGVRFRP
jgi:hypothetical protein